MRELCMVKCRHDPVPVYGKGFPQCKPIPLLHWFHWVAVRDGGPRWWPGPVGGVAPRRTASGSPSPLDAAFPQAPPAPFMGGTNLNFKLFFWGGAGGVQFQHYGLIVEVMWLIVRPRDLMMEITSYDWSWRTCDWLRWSCGGHVMVMCPADSLSLVGFHPRCLHFPLASATLETDHVTWVGVV